ncbi:3954_t:CDS:2 [Dentiscutata heterogama]|uniref:3954_t:CDS:1 n=1 Tax=Dentiscutata heterogama TaxID=1316150 RepID=A0ACA9KW29_9GLOM|nr:3954_t:CDS:2 [Dentiscutata heterogama]
MGSDVNQMNSEKKVRYLRSDATPLSDDNIQDIINTRNSIKYALEAIASKYKISTRRVYQIWRGNHLLIDSREEALRSNINILSLSEDSNHDANKFDSAFTAWENKIHDIKISKSTDLALEEDVVSDSKVKKTEGRKSRTETVRVSNSISSTESSESVLDLYKRSSSEIEKIRASGRALTNNAIVQSCMNSYC